MRSQISRVARLAICLGLAGCAHPQPPMPHYVAPAAGTPTARLMMRASLQPGESYGIYVFGGAQDCTQMQRVGFGSPTTHPDATTLPSDRLDTLEVMIFKPNNTVCRARFSFVPKSSHSYVFASSSQVGGCRASVLDATNPDAIQPEPTLRQRNVAGNACTPLAQSPLLSNMARSGSTDSAPGRDAPAAARAPDSVTDDDLKGLTGR